MDHDVVNRPPETPPVDGVGHEEFANLQAQEAALRTVAEEAAGFGAVLDTAGRVLFATAGLRNRIEGEMVGSSLVGWMAPEGREAFESALEVARREDATSDLYVSLGNGARGGRFHVRLYGHGRDAHDQPRRIAAVFTVPARPVGPLAGALSDLKERAPALYASFDREGRLTSVSPRLLKQMGMNETEVLGHHFLAFDASDDRRAHAPEILRQIFGAGSVRNMRIDLLDRDGQPVQYVAALTVENDSRGRPNSATAILHNISDLLRAQSQLRAQDSLLESINQNISEGIFRSTPSEGLVYVNQAMVEMFGFSSVEEQLESDPANYYADPGEREKLIREEEKNGRIRGVPVRFRRVDGTEFWGLMSSVPVLGPRGEVKYYDGAIVDITTQRETLAELQESRQRLAAHMIHSPLASVETNALGVISAWNPAAEATFGYTREETIGTSIQELLFSALDRDEATLALQNAVIHSGRLASSVFENRRRDESRVTCEWHRVPLEDAEGRVTDVLWLAQDITARVESEMKLKTYAADLERVKISLEAQKSRLSSTVEELDLARQRAEAATRAKDEFLANMSHEIRTPMNGVVGMASLLLETNLDDEQRDFARTIERSGDSLLTIINDILDFSKIEAGRLELESLPISPRDILEQSTEVLSGLAAEKGIELALDVDPSAPDWIVGDITRMRQVLVNLVSNAVKFTRAGEVVASLTSREIGQDECEIEFRVRDTGIGIPADKVAALFKPFTQAEASTTRRFGGTGLGLSISRSLAELMGGELFLESELGVGTTFTFRLRASRSEAPEHAPARFAMGDRAKSASIAVVYRNATTRAILTSRLRHAGASVTDFATASEALLAINREDDFDLWIVDHQLGDNSGAMLLEVLHETRPHSPFILLSDIVQRAQDERAHARILKPIRDDVLLREIARALDSTRDRSGSGVVAESASPVPASDVVVTPENQSRSLLIVEDDPVNLHVMEMMLAKLGWKGHTATNGEEAVEAFHAGRYSVVLMDIQMPVMDGLEATRRIRGMLAEEEQPFIVAITANAMSGDRQMCLDAGLDDYLPKPVDLDSLRRLLEQAEERERAVSPA